MGNFWEYKLSSEFPFNIIEYETSIYDNNLHWHNYLEIGLCTGGCGKFIFSDKTYDVSEGDIFIINNFENHVAVSSSSSSAHFLFILFLPELILGPNSKEFDFGYLSPFWHEPDNFCNKIDYTSGISESIKHSIYQIKILWDKKEDAYKYLVDAGLRGILALLIRHCNTMGQGSYAKEMSDRYRLQPVLDYINKGFKENIKVEEVADIIHLSESRFRHLFKEVMRIGFKEYIIYLRINEAKRLLLATDMNITDIIYTIRFSNSYQFYRQFYKYMSMSPAEYRRGYNVSFLDKPLQNEA